MKPTYYLLLASVCVFASCKEKEQAAAAGSSKPSAEEAGAVKAILETSPKGEGQSIHAVRESAKPGDEVTIKGRIMGNSKPFVDGRSAFILGDPTILQACNDKPGDECDTPWDSCCNTPEEKKKGTATVQIVNAEGRVLKEQVEGVGGIEKLATVTVTGKVAPGSSADLLIVNATAIHAGK